MPNYSYKCKECHEDTEKIVPIMDRDNQVCHCGAPLSRTITFNGIVWSPTKNGGYS